jgi:hypothetical protein
MQVGIAFPLSTTLTRKITLARGPVRHDDDHKLPIGSPVKG